MNGEARRRGLSVNPINLGSTVWAKRPRILALLDYLILLIVAAGVFPQFAEASTLYGYAGTIIASADVQGDTDSETQPIAGFGNYTATAVVGWCSDYSDSLCIGASGEAHSSAAAALGSEGFSVEIFSSAARSPSSVSAGSAGTLTLEFLVSDMSSWDLMVDAAGHYSARLFADGESTPLYSLESVGFPGDVFEGVVPLTLEAGAHRLELTGSHFDSTAGVISPGHFTVAFVPEPGTGLLVITGMLGLASWRRRRA